MADSRITRRSIMGAMALAPLALAAPAVAATPSTQWDRVLQNWQSLWDAYETHPFPRTPYDDPNIRILEADANGILTRQEGAFKEVIYYPVSDHRGLVQKLEATRVAYDDCEIPMEYLEAITRDVRRLGGLV